MALDTAAKRTSMIYFGVGGVPRPSGTVDAVERATLIGNYYIAPPAITTPSKRKIIAVLRGHDIIVHGRVHSITASTREHSVTPSARVRTITV